MWRRYYLPSSFAIPVVKSPPPISIRCRRRDCSWYRPEPGEASEHPGGLADGEENCANTMALGQIRARKKSPKLGLF